MGRTKKVNGYDYPDFANEINLPNTDNEIISIALMGKQSLKQTASNRNISTNITAAHSRKDTFDETTRRDVSSRGASSRQQLNRPQTGIISIGGPSSARSNTRRPITAHLN